MTTGVGHIGVNGWEKSLIRECSDVDELLMYASSKIKLKNYDLEAKVDGFLQHQQKKCMEKTKIGKEPIG
jgi:hypothetical protein